MAKKKTNGKGKKVLIIEDYPATSEMILNFLETEGIKASVAPDGLIGLKMVGSEKPDLILLDIMMPEMNGFEVLEKLKSDPKTAKIPVIVVSIRASEDSINKGKGLGADDYIPKPFDPFKLMEVVRKFL
ncbi:MAG: response regulator [Candidatus Margulisiibacteriota bacterium]|nr:response regulator [Candidatus Margulisiibacteriota bacterium]